MNTVYSQEEIIESLKVIKETCEKSKECSSCPFGGSGRDWVHCIIQRTPANWNIIDPDKTVWRAFQ